MFFDRTGNGDPPNTLNVHESNPSLEVLGLDP